MTDHQNISVPNPDPTAETRATMDRESRQLRETMQQQFNAITGRLTRQELGSSTVGEKVVQLSAVVTSDKEALDERLRILTNEFQASRRPNLVLILGVLGLWGGIAAAGKFVIDSQTDPLSYRIATIEANQRNIGDDAKSALEATHLSANADTQSRFDRLQLNDRVEKNEHQTALIADDHSHQEDELRERIVRIETELQDTKEGIAHAQLAGRNNPAP